MKPLLLSVLPRPPHPARDGSAIRNYHLLAALAAVFRVRVLALRAPHLPAGEYPAGVEAEEIPQPGRRFRRVRAAATSLLSGTPYPALLYRSSALERALERAVGREKPSWVLAHGFHVGAAAIDTGERVWIDFHNLDSRIWARVAETSSSLLARRFADLQVGPVRAMEARLAERAAGVSCVSKPEARALSAMVAGKQPLVLPNGVDLSRYVFGPEAPEGRTVFFVGDLSWPPNADAVRWFRREIWPLVAGADLQARAEILGREAPGDILSDPGQRFFLLGPGGDTREHWRKASVAVVPLRAGAGTRLKILEAAACGVPVVSTTVGAEGLELEPESEILLRDEGDAFARAIRDLLGDPQRRDRQARAARARVEALYDWTSIGARLAAALSGGLR